MEDEISLASDNADGISVHEGRKPVLSRQESQARQRSSPSMASLLLHKATPQETERNTQNIARPSIPTASSDSISLNSAIEKHLLALGQSVSIDNLRSQSHNILNATIVDAEKVMDSGVASIANDSSSDSDGEPESDRVDAPRGTWN